MFLLRMDDGQDNRITHHFITLMHNKLDVVESSWATIKSSPRHNTGGGGSAHVDDGNGFALILTGTGKFFSNGLSTEDLVEDPTHMLLTFHKLLARLLTFPIPTIAAINGHAFAGGAMLGLSCDYRVMNSQRGYLCVNEVDIGLTLTPGMYAVLRAKVNRSEWTPMMLGAKRYGGPEAVTASLVQLAVPAEDVDQRAMTLAMSLVKKGSNRDVYRSLKAQIYHAEIEMLKSPSLGEAQWIANKFSGLSGDATPSKL